MKKRNQIFKKIGAVLCACALFVSSMTFTDSYFAVDNEWYVPTNYTLQYSALGNGYFVEDSYISDYECDIPYGLISDNGGFYVLMRDISDASLFYLYISNRPLAVAQSSGAYVRHGGSLGSYFDNEHLYFLYTSSDNGANWTKIIDKDSSSSFSSYIMANYVKVSGSYRYVWYMGLCECNHYVINRTQGGLTSDGVYYYFWAPTVNFDGSAIGSESFNSGLGYLQNVSRKSTYIRDELYNYDDDSLTYHWYHDLTSTGGVDLTSGDYKIRHYISNAKVKGYDKSDIVEMSDKYLMNEYDASKGYFSYLQKDYLEKLEVLGYEEIGFIDKYLKGYFTLQHHYFQIVNTSTNEVGGYLHFYPKDASGENFGVEMVYEGLDLNDEIDPDAPNGFIDTDVGSGTTMEDALENADAPKLDDLGGIDPLIENLEGYASQITNVTNGIGALLGSLPPWFVGLLGLSFGLFFVLVAVKVIRG